MEFSLTTVSRPTIDDVLMSVAYAFSERGSCSRRQVGAVIATGNGVILSTGYNGALSGFPHCLPHTDYEPCEVSEHAERNAIFWAARRGVAIEGCSLYCTDSCCVACARGCIQTGIQRVVYDRLYKNDDGLKLLETAGIEVVEYA